MPPSVRRSRAATPHQRAARRAPLLLVPFKEIRHDQPDDCLHYESIAVRGHEMNWTIPAHRHDGLHQFQLLEKGRIQASIDGREFAVRAPLLLMIAPGSVHGFVYSRDTVGQQVTLPSLTLRQLLGEGSTLLNDLGASAVLAPLARDDARACRALFDRIGAEFGQARPGRVQALLACATLLALFCARQYGEQVRPGAAPGLRDTLVQRYLALIERHYREHRPLTFYAQQLGVTVDHLSRSCRSVQQGSALQLLQDRLMLEARRLLAYTQLPVAGIAQQLGFDDPAYFSKSFQRALGHAPTAYRTLVQKGVKGIQ